MPNPTNTDVSTSVTIGTVAAASAALVKSHKDLARKQAALGTSREACQNAFDALCAAVHAFCAHATLAQAQEAILEADITVIAPKSDSGSDFATVSLNDANIARLRDAHDFAQVTGGNAFQMWKHVGFSNQSKAGTINFGVTAESLMPEVREAVEANASKAKDERLTPAQLMAAARDRVNTRALDGRSIKGEREVEALIKGAQNFTGDLTLDQWVRWDRAVKALRPE